jgi:hypothetical protein
MPRSKAVTRQRDPLPDNFDSLEEFWAFWDTHSTADYEDLMEDVESPGGMPAGKLYFSVAKDIATPMRALARKQGVSVETLVNLWLQEKVAEAAQPQ